jgi:hypothetical protein
VAVRATDLHATNTTPHACASAHFFLALTLLRIWAFVTETENGSERIATHFPAASGARITAR